MNNETRPEEPRNRKVRTPVDWDVRGIIAIMAIVGAFGLAGALLASGAETAEIPTWAAALVSAITGFYFGSRGSGSSDSH